MVAKKCFTTSDFIRLLNCDLHHLIVLSVIKEEMDQGQFHDDYNLGN